MVRSARIEQEGRVQLAIEALKTASIATINAAARAFDVPISTLFRRLNGVQSRHETPPNCRKLTDIEELALVNWILDMDSRGYAPRVGDIRGKANILLAERVRGTNISPGKVGQKWATNFVKRREELCSKFLRKLDYKRAKICEDPTIIRRWFEMVANIKSKYDIHVEDMYNFDETGFQMGVISTAKVVTGSERRGRPFKTQPGNREWVTVIETIAANGRVLDPLIIFKGKKVQKFWFNELKRPGYQYWSITVSDNGWTNDKISLEWLEMFDEREQEAAFEVNIDC